MGKGINISGHNVVIRVSFLLFRRGWLPYKLPAVLKSPPKILNNRLPPALAVKLNKTKHIKTRTVFGQLHRFGRFLIHPILGFVLRMCQEKHSETHGPKSVFCVSHSTGAKQTRFFSRKKNIFPDYHFRVCFICSRA